MFLNETFWNPLDFLRKYNLLDVHPNWCIKFSWDLWSDCEEFLVSAVGDAEDMWWHTFVHGLPGAVGWISRVVYIKCVVNSSSQDTTPLILCCTIPVLWERQKKGAGCFFQEIQRDSESCNWGLEQNNLVLLAAFLGALLQLGQTFLVACLLSFG